MVVNQAHILPHPMGWASTMAKYCFEGENMCRSDHVMVEYNAGVKTNNTTKDATVIAKIRIGYQ